MTKTCNLSIVIFFPLIVVVVVIIVNRYMADEVKFERQKEERRIKSEER